jgi:isocitrate dehydrogenase
MNLNGDYLSDALAAQVSGSHRARANINYDSGHAVFEATTVARNMPTSTSQSWILIVSVK